MLQLHTMAEPSSTRAPASDRPVARVLPLLGLPQLDRLFDYRVDEKDTESVQPGVRVRVRFAGRLVDAFVYERSDTTEHPRELRYIDRIVSDEVVVTPEVFALVDRVAARWVGARSDVFRLAIPPRHATAERSVAPVEPAVEVGGGHRDGNHTPVPVLPEAWSHYPRAASFAAAMASGKPVRGAWTPAPGDDWAARLAELAFFAATGGRQSIVVVPDQRDVDVMSSRLKEAARERGHAPTDIVELTASLGPQARYTRWLKVLRGHAKVVVGTRSAVWAPAKRPGIIIVWDDGDDSLAEPRAPYPHAREVATLRSSLAQAPLLLAGPIRTPEVAALVEAGWAPEITAAQESRRQLPRIVAVTNADPVQARDVAGGHTRLPTVAMTMARQALDRGQPVLVQVPRSGYIPRLLCQHCRTPARCRHCHGPLAIGEANTDGAGALVCGWCGVHDVAYSCPECGSRRLRAGVVGASRTAEELGRMFPGTRIVRVSGAERLSSAPDGPMLVVATPGAEPTPEHGYGAAILLDAWSLLSRPDLRATQQAFRRWVGAARLVVSHADGGEVFCSAEASTDIAQALIRWDVNGFAHRELAERREVGFPPAAHLFAIDGASSDVIAVSDYVEDHGSERLGFVPEILGPVDVPSAEPLPGAAPDDVPERVLVRIPPNQVDQVSHALLAAVISRATRRDGGPVRIRLDPLHIG